MICRRFKLIKAILRTLVVVGLFTTSSSYADSLPERIDLFVSLFDYKSAAVSYDIRGIQNDYPTRLLTPDSMLPQTSAYPLKDIQQLYSLAQTCTVNCR